MAAEYTESIQVMLPLFLQEQGFEGVWFLVTPEVKKAYDRGEDGTIYEGILDNDSYLYKGLMHGTKLPFIMQGERLKPIVVLDALKNYEVEESAYKRTDK